MKVQVLLLTFLLVLEVVIAMRRHNLTVHESNTSYHFSRCKKEPSTSTNQNCNNVMKGCEEEEEEEDCRTKRNAGSASQCEEVFVCEDIISLDPTFNSTPSCPIVIPTKCSSFTTDATTNSIITSTTAQQGIQKTKDSLLPTVTSMSNKPSCSGLATNESITQAALGATVGLLSVLLILAIIGWVCTCVILRKKGTMNMDKTNNRYVKCHTYMTGVLHVYLLDQYTIMIFAIFDYSM